MSRTLTWEVLEDLMIEIKKKGVAISPDVINELRSAKLMIKISEVDGSRGDAEQKVEEYLGKVESYLINEAQKIFSPEIVDQWLKNIEEANAEINEKTIEENKFVTGVPRDQKWVRIEPYAHFTSERVKQLAKNSNLSVKLQKDGHLLVHGQQDGIKEFLKKMTAEAAKK